MAWTYDPTQLATSQLYRVRFLIADTDPNAELLQDPEITFAATQEVNDWGAAARCCEAISRNFLRKADVRIGRGGTTLTYSTAAKQYAEMAKDFRKRANAMNVPWSGGLSISEKEAAAANSDAVQPLFTKGMQASPWASQGNADVIADDDD